MVLPGASGMRHPARKLAGKLGNRPDGPRGPAQVESNTLEGRVDRTPERTALAVVPPTVSLTVCSLVYQLVCDYTRCFVKGQEGGRVEGFREEPP